MRGLRHRVLVRALLALALAHPAAVAAQPAVQLAPGTTLFQLDLSATPVGEFPTSIKQLKGIMEVVQKDGMPMLKASAASAFLITLPQVLPRDFTLEFDLVPKLGSNPQDLSFEGTPTINQGTGSAHVLWHATGYLAVIGGGGDNYESPMPEDLRATLPGVLTRVVADFQGPTVKLYTNGQRHYTLDKQFARGRVVRVFLGAQDDGTEAVYLAGLRMSTGSGLGIVAANAGLPTQPPAPRPGMPPATPSTATNPPASTPPARPPAQRPAPSPVIPRQPAPPPTQSQPPVNTPPPPPQPTTPPSAPPGNPPSPTPAPTRLPAPPPATRPGGSPAPAGPAGPATLTATDRAVWGASLRWNEVANAAGYQVDRSEAGGPFVLFAGVDAKAQPPVAGYFATEDVTVLPGVRYEYRVLARFASGPASQYSPTAIFDGVNAVAQISNLTATLSAPFQASSTAPSQQTVTWTWLGIPGVLTYEAEVEQFSGSNSLAKTRLTLPANSTPPYSMAVETGRSVKICISIIRPASILQQIRYGICLTTDVPGASSPAPAPTNAAAPVVRGGPVTTTTSAAKSASRCMPGAPTASPPVRFAAFGMRVGGAPLQWVDEANTEYLIERAPASAAGGSVGWTRLTSTCDVGAPLVSGSWLDEDLTNYPVLGIIDAVPGLQLGGAYQYRLTRIQADGTSGSTIVYWEAPSASFQASPTATVNGNTVALTTGVSYCQPLGIRCDPWMLEFAITSSSSGFSFNTRQPWVDTYDPALGNDEPGTMAFKVSGVPSGTHAFSVTALYQPDFRVSAGSVTAQVP